MNMKKWLLPVLILPFVCLSCNNLFGIKGKGNIVTEERNVTEFQNIILKSSADMYVSRADSFLINVSDYENLVQYLSVKSESRALVVGVDPATTILSNSKARVNVAMPDSLKSVSITGSGNIMIDTTFKDLGKLYVSGSGSILVNRNLDVNSLEVTILGSGNITAKGNVNSLKTVIAGSGSIYMDELVAAKANCSISGSGSTLVHVTDSLAAYISGSGNVIYSGSPAVVATTPGSGVVKRK